MFRKSWTALVTTDRLDHTLNALLELENCDVALQHFVQHILVMFHGNALVERSFALNKECLLMMLCSAQWRRALERDLIDDIDGVSLLQQQTCYSLITALTACISNPRNGPCLLFLLHPGSRERCNVLWCIRLSLSVCLSTRITRKPHSQTSPNVLLVLPMAMARCFSGSVAIRYVQWWKWTEGSGGTTVTTLLLYFALVLVHGSTKYRNCTVCSHYQLVRWWHQPILRTG